MKLSNLIKENFTRIGLLFLILALTSCKSEKKITQESFLFNTRIKITVYDKTDKDIKKIIDETFLKINKIESKYSSYEQDSFINKINDKSGEFVEIDQTGINLVEKAKSVSDITEGRFDITIKPLFDLWGFSNLNKTVPKEEEILKTLRHVNYKKIKTSKNSIRINKEQELDLSSFLKGYAIYRAGEFLKKNGIDNFLISSISSIESAGKNQGKLWRVGIQNPNEPTEILKILEITDRGIGVSGDYQTYFEVGNKRYHHILNAKTGYPVNTNKMVLVVTSNAYIADLYSTALFTLEAEDIIKKVENIKNMEALVIDSKNKKYYSKNMKKYIDNK